MRKLLVLFHAICLLSGLSKLHAQTPPYHGTIFIDPDIIVATDPSSIESTIYTGQGQRTVYDRRVNDWVTINAYLFDVRWKDGLTSEAIINIEFGSVAAATIEAEKYGFLIGQLPYSLRTDVDEIWIHKGVASFGGGNRSILIHTGQSADYEASGILEETLVHEASHTSLDITHSSAENWLAAQQKDGNFISTYAKDNPVREDIAETFLTWFAVRYRANRISQIDYDNITQAIPNRLLYLDNQAFNLTPAVITLPVKLVSFSAKAGNGNIFLNWATAHEQNALKFNIEKSEDGTRWRSIGSVGAQGNANTKQEYSFTDFTVATNHFYRLQLVDKNGSVDYSSVQHVQINTKKTISFYPNPVRNIITLTNLAGQPIINVTVTTVAGQKSLERAGNNNILNVESLAPGVYILQVSTHSGVYAYTFVKQ